MPYKTDKQSIGHPILRRNTKLLACQKEMCKHWHNNGASINAIARMFKVNKRLIQFILFPERHKKNLELRKERGGSKIYYKRKKHNDAMKTHRRYKHQLLSPS